MRMHHPNLPYTKKNGGVEVTEAQFRLAWANRGWLALEDDDDSGEEE
jgi:hypothetical protein